MRSFFWKSVLNTSLFFTIFLAQAGNANLNQDTSHLNFKLNQQNTAGLSQVAGSYKPGAAPTFDPNHLLPISVAPSSAAEAIMYGIFTIFDFTVTYDLVVNTTQVGELNIAMSNVACSVNGIPGRDPNGTSPDLPLVFKHTDWVYMVDVVQDTQTIPKNVICDLIVTAEANQGPAPISVQIANQTSTSDGSGTLGAGNVTLALNTGCSANPDCATAARNGVAPNAISPLFTFSQGSTKEISGTITYPIINDSQLGGNYNVIVNIQDGDTFPEQCSATTTVPTTGKIQYHVNAVQVGGNCQVNVTRTVQPVNGSPKMDVVINNQVCGDTGAGNICGPGNPPGYTFRLQGGETSTPPGMNAGTFNPTNPANIEAGQSLLATTLSTADGPGSPYQGSINYVFDDKISNSGPLNLVVALNNNNGTTLQDWCEAGINGVPDTRTYSVTTTVVDNGNNAATCTVRISANRHTPEPDYAFVQAQRLPSEGVRRWEHFVISNTDYLITDNAGIAGETYIGVPESGAPHHYNMFAFDPKASQNPFVNFDMVFPFVCIDINDNYIYTNHLYDWKFFTFNNVPAIIMANNQNYYVDPTGGCNEYLSFTQSYVLNWDKDANNGKGWFFDDQKLDKFYSIRTNAPRMWESFTTNGVSYMAVADKGNSIIYQLNGGTFTPTGAQLIDAEYIEQFNIAGQQYLAVSNSANGEVLIYSVDHNGNATIYQGSQVTANYTIGSTGVKSSMVFSQYNNSTLKDEYFLVLAYNTGTTVSELAIYCWTSQPIGGNTKSVFTSCQSLAENTPFNFANVTGWTEYTVNNKNYLAASFGKSGAYAFEWNNSTQKLYIGGGAQIWPQDGVSNIQSLTSFTPIGSSSLYIALAVSDTGGNKQTTSPIMQWKAQSSK